MLAPPPRQAFRTEVVRIDLIRAQLVGDAEGIEKAGGVGLHRLARVPHPPKFKK